MEDWKRYWLSISRILASHLGFSQAWTWEFSRILTTSLFSFYFFFSKCSYKENTSDWVTPYHRLLKLPRFHTILPFFLLDGIHGKETKGGNKHNLGTVCVLFKQMMCFIPLCLFFSPLSAKATYFFFNIIMRKSLHLGTSLLCSQNPGQLSGMLVESYCMPDIAFLGWEHIMSPNSEFSIMLPVLPQDCDLGS